MRPFVRHPLAFLASAAGAAITPVALAHHGFGTFVMDADIEITGTVTGLDFVNPHSWLYLDVVSEDGETVAMRCEMRSANTLRRSGWTPELFPVGKEVTITGSPDRDDPYSCYVSTVIFDDGSSLDRYGQITAPAEIGQGERPQRLANGTPNISGDWAQEQRVMTDPRGQRGTLVPLSEAEQYADDPEAAGVIGGARGTDQAAARAEAARLAREGVVESAAEAEEAARAAQAAAAAGRGAFGANTIELTEAGQAALDAAEIGDRYDMTCVFTNVVTEWSGDSGEVVNRVLQRGDTITIQYGRLGVERVVRLDVGEHPEGIEPSPTGHSIGRWEGDTLVVDTVGFEAGLWNSRAPHSEQLHVVEQFTFDTGTQQLRRTFVANDPLYWTAEQQGENATSISDVPYFSEVCEDLTIDREVELGPRGASANTAE